MDSGGCRDDIETDGGAGGCTPRAGKVGPRSDPGPYFLRGQSNDGDHAYRGSRLARLLAECPIDNANSDCNSCCGHDGRQGFGTGPRPPWRVIEARRCPAH
jgi:hypothetical protein